MILSIQISKYGYASCNSLFVFSSRKQASCNAGNEVILEALYVNAHSPLLVVSTPVHTLYVYFISITLVRGVLMNSKHYLHNLLYTHDA